MENIPDLPPPPQRPPGTIRLVLAVSVPADEQINDYIAVSDIEPPITHERLWRATRRMANYIMRGMIEAGTVDPARGNPEGAE
ncbi:MAG TPA: hypothetical protein VH599_07400 [Ktedonobacterales bacterium]|jgi:hypothetical protein